MIDRDKLRQYVADKKHFDIMVNSESNATWDSSYFIWIPNYDKNTIQDLLKLHPLITELCTFPEEFVKSNGIGWYLLNYGIVFKKRTALHFVNLYTITKWLSDRNNELTIIMNDPEYLGQ